MLNKLWGFPLPNPLQKSYVNGPQDKLSPISNVIFTRLREVMVPFFRRYKERERLFVDLALGLTVHQVLSIA